MNDFVAMIILWLSVTFGLPKTDEYPAIQFQAPARLATLRYDSPDVAENNVVGLYDSRTNTIYLRHDWDSSNPADVSVLVHELVHYLQFRAGLRFACPEEREELAYRAQAQWLAMYGKDLSAEFDLNPMTLKLRTKCLAP